MIIVTLASNVWTNLYIASGVAVGQSLTIQVQTPSARLVLKSQSSEPSASDISGIEVFSDEWYTVNASSTGAWIKPLSSDCVVAISTQYDLVSPTRFGGRAILYGNTIDRLATQALNYRDDAISRGLGYYAYHTEVVASGVKAYLRFQCPSDKYVVLISRDIIMNKEALIYRTYSAYTGGTIGASIPVKNLRTDTIYPPSSTINHITTPTPTLSSEVTYLPIYGVVGSGNRVAGSTDSSDTFRLLAPNSVFLIEIETTATSSNSVFVQFAWFELSQQVIL